MTQTERQTLVDLARKPGRCFLNGRRATISGVTFPFAYVVRDHDHYGMQYSWEAVARIMARDGKFQT